MGKVVPFRKPDLKRKAKAMTLCRHGYHKWKPLKDKRFDVKAGKLVTVYRCERCGLARNELT